MPTLPISIYGFIVNATLRQYDLERMVDNYCSFSDDVNVATGPSEDDTLDRLLAAAKKHSNLRIIKTNIDIKADQRFDGHFKTAALQGCKNKIRMIMDFDEVLLLTDKQRELWKMCADYIVSQETINPNLHGFFIPVIDLYGSKDTIRNQPIGVKFRLHTDKVIARGVPSFAEMGNGLFDAERSDATEPLISEGVMANFAHLVDPRVLQPCYAASLPFAAPLVIHEGFLDLSVKAKRGKDFWADKWNSYSGKDQKVATDESQLLRSDLVRHGIKLS